MQIETIVFDFGGVLIDWNPRHLFRKIFSDNNEMETFLREVCTDEWNAEQDRGRTLKDGTEWLVERHPEKESLIRMYYDRWTEMLNGPIQGTVDILAALKKHYPVYGLTNWSAETFPIALERYEFLQWLNGILVSGEEKLMKPDPVIYELLASRFNITPQVSLFIDDNIKNVKAAGEFGFQTIHFKDPVQLNDALNLLGVKL
jgi:2-haloacid dehalogenase